jgi:dipeptidyl aminopeptidase/acylaminoacyl peptidase
MISSGVSFSQSSGPDLLSYIDSKGRKAPVKTLSDWQIKRGQILDSMQALFGKLPDDPNLPPFNTRIPDLPAFNPVITDSIKTNFYTRYNVRFTVAKNEDVTAYLYIPLKKEKGTKLPAMLALHQTEDIGKGSVDGQGPYINLAYAKELAQRGYIVIAPDYPSFGDQKNYNFTTDRYESGVMKAIFNHIRCVDFLQARPDVDPERIGVIGHSLGGHSAMYVAAFDTRIKVVVSSCGWTPNRYYNNYNEEMRKKMGGRLWGYAQERYSPLALTKYKLQLENMPFDFDDVIAAIAPRPFFSNSPVHDANFNVEGVRVGIANASQVYHFLNADDNLQVRYPVVSHDFPPLVRYEAYDFIDKYLKK